jgi:hypothetical protein
LMSQETTGLFYNVFLLGRYRYPEPGFKRWITQATKYIFATFFAIFRIGIGTYGASQFLSHYNEQLVGNSERGFAAWQAHVLAFAVCGGVLMQLYFFYTIIAMMRREGKKGASGGEKRS